MYAKIEGVIHEGYATDLLIFKSIYGKLYLTRDSLIFDSYKYTPGYRDSGYYLSEYPLKSIVKIRLGNRFLILPTKIILELDNGEKVRFSVKKRKVWLEQIRRVRPIDVRL